MDVHVEHLIPAAREDLIDFMLSQAYRRTLCEKISFVSRIELEHEERKESVVVRTLRYEALTKEKIPSFLKRYASKAPEHVYWEQRECWNLSAGKMTFSIKAEIPEAWQHYYTQSGELLFEELAAGDSTRLKSSLSYEVNVFGLKRLIEKAARQEVQALLTLQGDVAAAHFAS